MICVECQEHTTAVPCARCGAEPRVDGRYAIQARVGRGAVGVVYRATAVATGEDYALKQVMVGHLGEEAALRLARREGAVLRQLAHPGVPAWREELLIGRGRAATLFLVQGFVEGEDLQAGLVAHRWTEGEVLALLAEVLDILVYLHGLHPPVVHRDIKPANLIRRVDGGLSLVDFGAVQDAFASVSGGATVAGTFGFMAPEVFAGGSGPASDLYSLGMTAVALLSRAPPASLHLRDGAVTWRAALRVRPPTLALLERLLEPDAAQRPTAAEARRAVEALLYPAAPPAPAADPRPAPAAPHLPNTAPPTANPTSSTLFSPEAPNEPLARAAAPPGQLAQARPALVLGARVALISGALLLLLVLVAQGLTARLTRPQPAPTAPRVGPDPVPAPPPPRGVPDPPPQGPDVPTRCWDTPTDPGLSTMPEVPPVLQQEVSTMA
ncbi:MAG: hypothetical protein RL071_1323, partial [Pseudomonadota bacterium]